MFPTKEDTGGLRVPLVSFTGRDPRSIPRSVGESLVRVGAVGIRIRETPLRFPNSWAGGQTFPRAASYRQNPTLCAGTCDTPVKVFIHNFGGTAHQSSRTRFHSKRQAGTGCPASRLFGFVGYPQEFALFPPVIPKHTILGYWC